jgi:hypothetical protein
MDRYQVVLEPLLLSETNDLVPGGVSAGIHLRIGNESYLVYGFLTVITLLSIHVR